MKPIWTGSIIIFFTSVFWSCSVQEKDSTEPGITYTKEENMQWWREARFGMFIHWGIYSIPGGEWKGEKIGGISEWIMSTAKIPVKEYEKLTTGFNPTEYDADAWVRLAKEAGMKYIVITSKHHDGFAMFHSKANPYNIVDATPFDRDPLKELAEACQKHGLRLGFYYSQAQDWHHPGGTFWDIEEGGEHWDTEMERTSLNRYMEEKSIPQARELLSNYGKLAIMWWDTPKGMTEEAAKKLQDLLDLQPGIISNNRLYKPWKGDFGTPEQRVPPMGLDYDWETCMTMNTSWGYKHYDHNWKSVKQLIRYLADAASKGGNFLLNVGPTPEGTIPQPSIERLKGIGKWMEQNGESIYGTQASPFYKLTWGRCTQKKTNEGTTKLYLHVWDWPEDGRLKVPGLKSEVKTAWLLANNTTLNTEKDEQDLWIDLTMTNPDPINTVVVLECIGNPEIISNMPAQNKDGSVVIRGEMINVYNKGYEKHAYIEGKGVNAFVNDWEADRAFTDALFTLEKSGDFQLSAELSTEDDNGKLTVKHEGQSIEIDLPNTSGQFQWVDIGTFSFASAGVNDIEMRPVRGKWTPTKVRTLKLEPQQ